MKRFAVIAMTLLMAFCLILSASAERSVDENGNYHLEYDKSAYDGIIFGDKTFGVFLRSHGNSSFDFEQFQNSDNGQFYAHYAALAAQYRDNMDEGLLNHWREVGLEKILVRPENAQDTTQDYYVYLPLERSAEEKLPLVVVNHGRGANARVCESFGWCEIAAREKLMLVMAENTEPDFLHEVITQVKEAYPVDSARVFMTGTSQGAHRTKLYVSQYPNDIAAIGLMNIGLKFHDSSDTALEAVKVDMPMIFVIGTSDSYNILPISQRSAITSSTTEGWNNLMALTGHAEYQITDEESEKLREESTNILSTYTGLRLPEPIIYTGVNSRAFQCNFEKDGMVNLSLVLEENGPHDPLRLDANLVWDFMKPYARNTETGELIVLP